MVLPRSPAFKRSRQPETVEKRDCAEDSERAVDQAPTHRDLANRSTNQRQRDYQQTSQESRLQDPHVPRGIDECPEEENGQDKVRECQPVGAVSQPGILGITVAETVSDSENPSVEADRSVSRRNMFK